MQLNIDDIVESQATGDVGVVISVDKDNQLCGVEWTAVSGESPTIGMTPSDDLIKIGYLIDDNPEPVLDSSMEAYYAQEPKDPQDASKIIQESLLGSVFVTSENNTVLAARVTYEEIDEHDEEIPFDEGDEVLIPDTDLEGIVTQSSKDYTEVVVKFSDKSWEYLTFPNHELSKKASK